MSHGKVRQFSWEHKGKTRKAWGFTVTIDGQRVRKSGWLSKAEAAEALDRVLHPEPVVALSAAPVSITLAEAFDRYLAEKARKLSLRGDRRNAKVLMAVFGADTPLHEVTAAKISEYRAARLALPITAHAVNRPLALLRHLLRLAADEWEVLGEAPTVRLAKEPQGRLRWLTPEEAHRLLDACRQHRGAPLADLVEVCLYTGLRQAEALGLTWARVDRARGVLLLERTKSGRRREVPGRRCPDPPAGRWWHGPGVRVRVVDDVPQGLGAGPGGRPVGRAALPRPAPHLRVLGGPARGDPAGTQGLAWARDLGYGDAVRAPQPRASPVGGLPPGRRDGRQKWGRRVGGSGRVSCKCNAGR